MRGTAGGTCMALEKKIYIHMYIWGFPLVGVPRSGWFVMENPSEMDD